MRKFVFVVLIFVLLAGFGLFLKNNESFFEKEASLIAPDKKESKSKEVKTKTPEFQEPEIKMVIVGDMMVDRGVEYMIKKKGKGDFRYPFLRIASYLKDKDLVFGNLEGPVSDKGKKVGSIYSFRSDPQVTRGLKYAGFDILSLANNHALDYGREALKDTMNRLEENGIDYVGAGFDRKEAFSMKVKEINDSKIGFLSFTNLGPVAWRAEKDSSGIAWIGKDLEKIRLKIQESRSKADVLIVALHWGKEYQKEPTSFQKKLGRACIDAGADLVVGHHPHIVQQIKEYKEGWIAYSLGNFVFDQGFSEETMRGLLLEIVVKDGRIKEVNPRKIRINNYFQPEICEKR